MIDQPKPKCWVLGGTNGSGKSSIYQNSLDLQGSGEFVNADLIARAISPTDPQSVSRLAGRSVIEKLDRLISDRSDFVYETTLSSQQSLELLRTTRRMGYRVALIFVVLSSVGLHVKRVHERVSRGGHSIPDGVIRRRYRRAFANLPDALQIAHDTVVFDNSGKTPVKLLSVVDGEIVQSALDDAAVSKLDVVADVQIALETFQRSIGRAL